jgi:uncharacterized membrane protein YsdA (DUF1294 family)
MKAQLLIVVGLACAWMSVVTYIVYALDKNAARRRRHRVAERTLHLLALVGGWPGALIAQRLLRHKTHKRRFLALFWLTAIAHVAAVTAFVAGS